MQTDDTWFIALTVLPKTLLFLSFESLEQSRDMFPSSYHRKVVMMLFLKILVEHAMLSEVVEAGWLNIGSVSSNHVEETTSSTGLACVARMIRFQTRSCAL